MKIMKKLFVVMLLGAVLTAGTVWPSAHGGHGGGHRARSTQTQDQTYVCPYGNEGCAQNGHCVSGCEGYGLCHDGAHQNGGYHHSAA